MNTTSYHIVRIALAITFVWTGVFIYMEPDIWGSMVAPWVLHLLPMPIHQVMIDTAILDICIGILFLINPLIWIAALLGALHLISVLIATGVSDITVRDIGLLGACIAVALSGLPLSISRKFNNNTIEHI